MATHPPTSASRRHSTPTPLALGGPLCGRYELGPILGRGGMSEVREARDLKLGRTVAIKLLHSTDGREENRARFATEARVAATLTSPHIVVVHDVGEHEGLPFIVMERLPGVSLSDHIARGPLPPALVGSVLESILAALAVAHEAGILHRDVKPGNVLFTAAGEAKLGDFGIAKTDGGVHTMTGEIVGSMAYLSPNRLLAKPATPADDLYAVGVVGYEALAGHRPFPQTGIGPLAHAILHETPPPLASLLPDAPRFLTTTIERAIARDPAHRFEHAGAMRAALVGTGLGPGPVLPPAPQIRTPTKAMTAPLPAPIGTYGYLSPPSEPSRSKRRLWLAVLIATLLLAVILIAVIEPFSASPPAPVTTTTPLPPPPPPPTTTMTTPDATVSDVPEPAPGPPRNPPHKKPKGGKGH